MKKNIEETKRNIIDAIEHRDAAKIPVGIDLYGWAFHYAGVGYDEVCDDAERAAGAFCEFLTDHPLVDMTSNNYIAANPYKAFEKLGLNSFVLSGDRTTVIHNQAAQSFMGPEIYDEITADAGLFMGVTFPEYKLAGLLEKPFDEALGLFEEACNLARAPFFANDIVKRILADEQGIYGFFDESPIFCAPFDMIFASYRGIKDSLVDLRRRAEKVYEASDALWEMMLPMLEMNEEEMTEALPVVYCIYNSECFLSPGQFDRLVFRYLMEGVGPALEKGKKMLILGEGSVRNTIERFREVPKNSMVILLDKDDIYEIKKLMGEWITLCGGIRLETLQSRSREECIDEVKRSFDLLAPGGGFLFFPDQELVSGKDAKAENLIAALEEADRLSRQ